MSRLIHTPYTKEPENFRESRQWASLLCLLFLSCRLFFILLPFNFVDVLCRNFSRFTFDLLNMLFGALLRPLSEFPKDARHVLRLLDAPATQPIIIIPGVLVIEKSYRTKHWAV